MKSLALGRLIVFIVIVVAWFRPAYGQDGATNEGPTVSAASQAAQLAAQVRSFAGSRTMSRSKKEQWISNAVRVAVVAATAYQDDPARSLAVGIRLSSAAARAAPEYAESIAKAAAFSPTMTRISGSSGQIRASTLAAARGRSIPQVPLVAAEAVDAPESALPTPRRRPPPRDLDDPVVEAPATPTEDSFTTRGTSAMRSTDRMLGVQSRSSRPSLGSNFAAHVTLDTSATSNDNIYQTPSNKTHATVLSATPGIQIGFGEHSLAKGTLMARESFTRYSSNTAPNANLANVTGQLSYDGAVVSSSASGSFEQTNQNSPDYVLLPNNEKTKELLRTDSSAASANLRSAITAQMGARAGVDYTRTAYRNEALVGNHSLSFPAAVYYAPDPKLDVFAGVTYGTTTPTGTGPKSRDIYYNIGAAGRFTEKLSGNFSVGYRTREADLLKNTQTLSEQQDQEHMLGFNGSFDYKVTEKTTAALRLSRNFNSNAFGQSTRNAGYGLTVRTNLTPQFSASAAIGYNNTQYGAVVFVDQSLANAAAIPRHDSGWDNSLSLSYAINRWLTTVFSYNFRNNRAEYDSATSLQPPDYDNNLFTLTLGMQY